jgi:phosphoribosylamine--glycine ligase
VVKADGLAAGKGVVVAATVAEAEAAIAEIMEARVHGAAGASVVIEECLVGEEVSFFALCDGERAIPLGAAQDHKRVGRATPARTPAAWAPIRRRPPSRRRWRRR